MSQGTAINNHPRFRSQLPRQLDGARNQFPKPGFFFVPFDPSEEESQSGKLRRDQGGSSPILVFLLLVLLLGAGIYIYLMRNAPLIEPSTLVAQNVTEVRYVNTYELNLRETPSDYSPIKIILPRGTRTEVLKEAQQEFDGDVWVKVRVQTREGLQDGWVNARYLR